MSSYSAVPIEAVPETKRAWQLVVEASPDAWFWHTWANMQFNFVAAQKTEARNLSFFVMQQDHPVAIVPLMVNRTKVGEVEAWEASYYGGPMPWPAFVSDLLDRDAAEQFALGELEKCAREAGAERIRLRLEPPVPATDEHARLERAVAMKYLNSSYESHWIAIDENTLGNVRERYRRYVRKFGPSYEMSIASGDTVSRELEEIYFNLHVKDAGGQFRSRESYCFQASLARENEAFFVVVKKRSTNTIAGMLLVSAFKNVAYDNSVAVDPDYQAEYVSHLLKWAAIEELLRRGVTHYELGPKSGLPGILSMPSEKQRGISHFKEGWARGGSRRVAMAEKFLSARLLHAWMQERNTALIQYFGLE